MSWLSRSGGRPVGAGRLIAATAPSFVLVDRLARCIGHHPVPRSASLRRPAAGSAGMPCALIQARTSDSSNSTCRPILKRAARCPCLRHQAGTPHRHSPLTIDHRPRPDWVAALRPASPQVTGAIYGCGTRTTTDADVKDVTRFYQSAWDSVLLMTRSTRSGSRSGGRWSIPGAMVSSHPGMRAAACLPASISGG